MEALFPTNVFRHRFPPVGSVTASLYVKTSTAASAFILYGDDPRYSFAALGNRMLFSRLSGPYSQDNKPLSLRWCPGRAADRRCPDFERGVTLNKFVYDSCSAAASRAVDLNGSTVAQRLMGPLRVVKLEILG